MSIEDLLTDRQKEVYALVLKGKSNEQIASELHISLDTTKAHCKKLLKLSGTASRHELMALRIQELEKQVRQLANRI